jgi:hypothetical protein
MHITTKDYIYGGVIALLVMFDITIEFLPAHISPELPRHHSIQNRLIPAASKIDHRSTADAKWINQFRLEYRSGTSLAILAGTMRRNWQMCAWAENRAPAKSEVALVHCVYDGYLEALSGAGYPMADLETAWIDGLLEIASRADANQMTDAQETREVTELRAHITTEMQLREQAIQTTRAQQSAAEMQRLILLESLAPAQTETHCDPSPGGGIDCTQQ